MREIKFRGKRIDKDEWVYGDLIHGVNHKSGKMYILPIRGGVMALGHGLDPIDGYEVIPETVGQYVGLMDLMTKDGYEGDIIERDASDGKGKVKGVIVFEEGQFRVAWFDKNKGWNNSLYIHLQDSKIIGKTYENPELLK